MADENTPADAPATPVAPRRPRHAKRRVKHTKTVRESPREARVSRDAMPAGVLIAVYVILGLIALGLSFWTGYLVGQNSDGTVRTGSGGVDKLTVIEYSDFECPFCARAAPTVKQIQQTYGDKVDVVYKHFPLESIHPNAFNAAVAAECVEKYEGEDVFWQYHDVLFANQQALDVASLKRYAQQVGAGSDVASCIDSQETAADVRADMAEAQGRGVQGTPSFWIHDELVVGALPFESFKATIDRKLSGAPAAPAAPTQPSAPPPQPTFADVEPGRYPIGEENAPVEIIEFTDFECPFCARHFTQTKPQIIEQYVETGQVRYSVRHFPLSFHPNAQKASEAVECAGQQGQFWEMHDKIFENQQALAVANLKQYAADIGLNTATFNQCLDSGATAAIVQEDFAAGQAAGVSGTPSFYVNGKQIVGAQPFSAFQAAIEAELQ